ncbi:tetratricopeptide repeat protein [Novosphingobium bradum]|uniref:Tetratricopeptide repeat protein n=1 Tax=Novosphingobium bradum TaxID=1737444 RepID=A0ABV7IPA4_9SPHN
MVLRPHSNRPRTPVPAGAPAAPGGAQGAPQGEGFLREVDDALREQEMLDAFRRYGKLAASAIVLFLVVLAGYLWWEHAQTAKAGERGEQLTLALDQVEAGKLDAARADLARLADGKDGVSAAAQMLAAGILVEQNKVPQAKQAFAAVAADDKAPQPYRDLAAIREIALGFDALPADQVVARLKPLAVPGKPFFGNAGELLGVAYMKQNRTDLAGPLFAAIARDKTVPETLRRRARQMAGLLGVDAVDDVNAAANGQTGGAVAPAPAPEQAPAAAAPAR